MSKLFTVLEGFISNVGDMVDDRASIEDRLRDTEEIQRYVEACGGADLSPADAERLSAVGLEWVRQVNDGDGEWGLYRDQAKAALDD